MSSVDNSEVPLTSIEAVQKIELVWPEKGRIPIERDGRWSTVAPSTVHEILPLRPVSEYGARGEYPSLVVTGSRIAALRTLRKTIGHRIKLVYADVPRIEGFDETRAFQGESGKRSLHIQPS